MNIKQDILSYIANKNDDFNRREIGRMLDMGYTQNIESTDNGIKIFLTKGTHAKDITLAIAGIFGLDKGDIDFEYDCITLGIEQLYARM